MKKCFSVILFLSALLIGTKAEAQFSIGAGYGVVNNTFKLNDVESTDMFDAAYVGLAYNFSSSSGIGFTPGFYFTYMFENSSAISRDERSLTVPLMLNYSHDFSGWFSAAIAIGPTGTFVLANNGADMKTFSLGIGSSLVFTFSKHIAFNASYDFGCTNRYDGPVEDGKLRTNKLCFGIAYMF